jgi:hypothetical protein
VIVTIPYPPKYQPTNIVIDSPIRYVPPSGFWGPSPPLFVHTSGGKTARAGSTQTEIKTIENRNTIKKAEDNEASLNLGFPHAQIAAEHYMAFVPEEPMCSNWGGLFMTHTCG